MVRTSEVRGRIDMSPPRSPRRSRPLGRGARSCRPGLESLEGRIAPAALTGLATPYVNLNLVLLGSGHPVADGAGNVFATEVVQNGDGSKTGSVIEIVAATNKIKTVATFPTNDAPGLGLAIDSGGNLYGTATGPDYPDGAVFSVGPAGGSPTILAKLDAGTTGSKPSDLLLDGSTLYGTTGSGGPAPPDAGAFGTVFSMSTTGGTPDVLATFNGSTASQPNGGLILSGTTLYGTSSENGLNTVFAVDTGSAGGSPTILGTFSGYVGVNGNLVASDGFLYGTTLYGSQVFKVPMNGGVITSVSLGVGQDPVGGLIAAGSEIIGMSDVGGSGHGVIFSVDPSTLLASTVAQFNSTTGGAPIGSLGIGGDGNVYGVAQAEGAATNHQVIAFKLSGLPIPSLTFAPNPAGGPVGQPIPTFKVDLNNVPSGGTVTLTLGPTAPAGGSVSGTLSAPVVNGVATFSNVVFSTTGSYTLVARSSTGLTVTSAPFGIGIGMSPQVNFTWSGLGSGNWSDPKDWQGNVAPTTLAPVTLSFPAGAPKPVSTDDIPELVVANLLIYGNDVITGTATLVLDGNVVLNPASGGGIIACPLLNKGVSVFVGQKDLLGFYSPISGSGQLTMDGPGEIELAGSSSYTGGTVLTLGTVIVDVNNSFGTGPLTLKGGSLFANHGVLTLANQVTVAGVVGIAGSGAAILVTSNPIKVTANSMVEMVGVDLSTEGGVMVAASNFLALEGGVTTLEGTIAGHVYLFSGFDYLQGNLAAGSTVDIDGATVSISSILTGAGAINVNIDSSQRSFLTVSPQRLSSFVGTITLETGGTLYAYGSLGIGTLRLLGGAVFTNSTLNLTNALSYLGGNVALVAPAGQRIIFANKVSLVSNASVAIANSTPGGNMGVAFLEGIVFGAATQFVSFIGVGFVQLPAASTPPKQVTHGPGVAVYFF